MRAKPAKPPFLTDKAKTAQRKANAIKKTNDHDKRHVFDEIAQLFDWSEFNIELIEPARNAQEALQTLMTTPVDIIIIDINMPGVNGIDLLREIRGRSMRQHVIVLSGYDDFEYVRTASLLGIDNYFLKRI